MPIQPPGQLRGGQRNSPILAWRGTRDIGKAAIFGAWADYYNILRKAELARPASQFCQSFADACTALWEAFSDLEDLYEGAKDNMAPTRVGLYTFWWRATRVPIPPDNFEVIGVVNRSNPLTEYWVWMPKYGCPSIGLLRFKFPDCWDETYCWVCVAEFQCPTGRAIAKHVVPGTSFTLPGARLFPGKSWGLLPAVVGSTKCACPGGEPPPIQSGVTKAFLATTPGCGTLIGYDYYPLSDAVQLAKGEDECLDQALDWLDAGVVDEATYEAHLCRCETMWETYQLRRQQEAAGELPEGMESSIASRSRRFTDEVFAVLVAVRKLGSPRPASPAKSMAVRALRARLAKAAVGLGAIGGAVRPRPVSLGPGRSG